MRKMLFEILLFIIVVFLLVYLFFIFARIALSPGPQQYSLGSVCIKEKCFSVELARTDTERERGLMLRTQLDKDKGMLFIFEKEGIYSIWMKNTFIPLDIVWADSQGKVVYISENAQPCQSLICPSAVPATKAKYVLEVNAGICKEVGIKLGDELGINID